jgi:hypothetical protein
VIVVLIAYATSRTVSDTSPGRLPVNGGRNRFTPFSLIDFPELLLRGLVGHLVIPSSSCVVSIRSVTLVDALKLMAAAN